MTKIQTEVFDLAYKFITETNVNVFLTGKAGSGKTTFLKYLKENATKSMAVAAPTGVAAINAGGVTLHSMFQLPFGIFIPTHKETNLAFDKKTLLSRMRFNSEKLAFFRSLELLVIDEASMVASHSVDAIDTILRSVRHKQVPFGGVQVLFIGDLYQLQPVVKKDEWQLLKEYYSSPFFFDSHVLRDSIPVMIELKKIFRQKDQNFIDILNGIRENELTQEHLRGLNGRLNTNFIPADGDGYITLTTHNDQATRINEIRLKRLSSPPLKFVATIEDEFPEHMIPAEKELVLKKNAQVMFIKNDLLDRKFFNGKIGIITEISDDEIMVLSDGEKIKVGRHTWENIKYTVDKETKHIREEIIGTFTQYPLRLAWAITIHKSQGLTFDKVVIDAENAFVNGQVYVALSRATSLEGLILTSPLNDRFLGAHLGLKQWQEKNYDEKSLPVLFDKARLSFMRQELFNAFSFEHFRHSLQILKKELDENTMEPDAHKWMKEFSALYYSISNTADKFKEQLQIIWNQNHDADKNEKLNLRVKEASVYFTSQLGELKKLLAGHEIKVNNHRSSRKLDKILQEVNEAIAHSLIKINICLGGFRFDDLLAWKKAIPKSIETIKSSYIASERKEKNEETQSELYIRISEFRREISEEREIPLFLIFSNTAIKKCSELMPADKASLLAVDGLGKKKVEEFGDELLQIIRGYCEENNLTPNSIDDKAMKKMETEKFFSITATVKETIDLFKSGKSISEISLERKLASSTIEGHLAKGIKNKIVDINKIMPKEEIDSIASGFTKGTFNIKDVKQSNGDIPYGKLRMVQAWLIAEKEGG